MVLQTAFLNFASHPIIAAHGHTVSFHLNWTWQALLALIAGVLALIRPKNLHIIVAAYLIILGVFSMLDIGF